MFGRGSIRPFDEPDYKDAQRLCECGGEFTQGAKPRCLKCRSTRLRKEPNPLILLD